MKLLQTALLLLTLAIALPACAVQEHHPGTADAATLAPTKEATAPAMQMDMAKIDSAMMQMQDTGMKMQAQNISGKGAAKRSI